MMTIKLKVKNMKCMGCVNTILGNLPTVNGITNVKADLVSQTVTFDYETQTSLEQAIAKLKELGYPAEKQ
ncbi:MAG: heavy-metal-associated domain-containing protein [Tenuifilum sp.]|uniref:heavy-metal-associated domain-containing protein n=1 Tax=Tenuifilum sp. TaxID=2760880 RepID=UPI0019CC0AE2|nr:heavy-metal-associated domain-containing protein [Bacteroidales bacterium]HOK61501.1 heavy-metal-associated domain-containing protein [Tenuifilum sp.]HOK85196.1 heavy-metal-associated domain-containing protein [Tenuifilum sp.]HPP89799.1 heavy-metal-associated domain-containing protein [Tenuifilum sp.]